jgi:hypothetical protein
MRKSKAHEYRQPYKAQAVACADGAQLILAVDVATTPTDQPTFAKPVSAGSKGSACRKRCSPTRASPQAPR